MILQTVFENQESRYLIHIGDVIHLYIIHHRDLKKKYKSDFNR